MTAPPFLELAKQLLEAKASVLTDTPPTPALLAQLFLEGNPSTATPTPTPPWTTTEPSSDQRPTGSDAEPEQRPGRSRPSAEESPARLQADQLQTDRLQAHQLQPDRIQTAPLKAPHPKTNPDGLLADNAGLVLLAVYLPPFFHKLGLDLMLEPTAAPTANGQEQDPRHRAVHLLHYLATGQEQPEEPLLVLPKILCGLAVETPVPQDLQLRVEEKDEAQRLLQAIIHNWAVLKNTSPSGLREGFLRRDGLLSWSESRESWLLRVERLGQDLLLERLPWSYSVIKLPWMEGMLTVEW